MKKIILMFAIVVSMSTMFGQTCQLRLEGPATPPNPGDDFYVSFWLDDLTYTTSTIKSAQIMFEYDEANVQAISTGPPFNRYWYNLNQMFVDYSAQPANNVPFPGDLRYVFYTTIAPGMDPSFYGGIPMKLWDIKFHYTGGPIDIQFGTTVKYSKNGDSEIGGKMSKAKTIVTAWDNSVYTLTSLTGYTYSPGGAGTDYVWNGSQGNNQFTDPLNWTPNGVPGDDPLDTATIPGGTNLCASSAADHTFAALTVQNGGLCALSANSFHITGDMTVDAGGFFYMGMDPASNAASSLVVDGNFLGDGLYTYGYYIPMGDADWHAISAPLGVMTDGMDLYNGFDGFLNDFYLNSWDETNNTFVQQLPNGCDQPDFTFGNGQSGFILLDADYATTGTCVGTNPATIDYTGGLPQFIEMSGAASTVNNADMAYPLTFTAGGSYAGWNLVGNPFPGTFDITATTWDVGVDASVYAFDGTNYIMGTAAGVGNTLMPAGQGFFVHTNNNANFNFDKAAVVMATNPVLKSETQILKLRATDGQYEDFTYINLDKQATENFDSYRDAYKKFTPVEAVPQMYTKSAEGTNLSINSFDMLDETMDLFFRAGVNGSFTIDAVETANYSTVILEDTFTGVTTNLLSDSYTFDYNTTDNDGRFVLHFSPLGVSEVANQGIDIYSNESTIYVNIDNTNASSIVVYDLLGQEVLRTSANQGLNTIEMNDDNYYLVSVILNDNVVNAKVFVK